LSTAHCVWSVSPLLFFLMISLPPRPTLFPYTTLFRSMIIGSVVPATRRASRTGRVNLDKRGRPGSGATAPDYDFGQNHTGRTCRSEEHTSELQSHLNLVCRLLLEKKNSAKCTIIQ